MLATVQNHKQLFKTTYAFVSHSKPYLHWWYLSHEKERAIKNDPTQKNRHSNRSGRIFEPCIQQTLTYEVSKAISGGRTSSVFIESSRYPPNEDE